MAKLYGSVERARAYDTSIPQIEFSCCPGVICGNGRRTGLDRSTGLAIYRLDGFRHPELRDTRVIVDRDGQLLRAGDLSPIS